MQITKSIQFHEPVIDYFSNRLLCQLILYADRPVNSFQTCYFWPTWPHLYLCALVFFRHIAVNFDLSPLLCSLPINHLLSQGCLLTEVIPPWLCSVRFEFRSVRLLPADPRAALRLLRGQRPLRRPAQPAGEEVHHAGVPTPLPHPGHQVAAGRRLPGGGMLRRLRLRLADGYRWDPTVSPGETGPSGRQCLEGSVKMKAG